MHERVLEGSILLSEVTSLTRARRLYDVFEKNWNYLLRLHLTRAWRVPVISGYRAKIKGAPRDRVPLSLMTSWVAWTRMEGSHRGMCRRNVELGGKRHPKEECNG